ncbi:hypothetical protein BJY04DRAFT_210517 [Aspergillus karnatakaensis]|uniref:uncharacterized protein n=1 Tax=Aspergillus karnatakaensis TaxID=1810916 RepID=UPI003CCDA0DD
MSLSLFCSLTELIRYLGFQHQRAKKCITPAQTWLASPPFRGSRYRKLHDPYTNDGRDVRPGECLDDEDKRVGWEVAHLPGVGAYSLDSRRIFRRDDLGGSVKAWQLLRTLAREKVMRAAKRAGIAREAGDENWMLETSPVREAVNRITMDD